MVHIDKGNPSRRDFLYLATGALGAAGTVAAVWPFIAQMNPDASVLALSTIAVDLSSIDVGQSITVTWNGKPIFIRQRTPAEISAAQQVQLSVLIDQNARNPNLEDNATATDANRTVAGKEQWLVMIGICTHLGCIPLGQQGDYGGWFCPCHGSQYDTAGRVRVGPAPENLFIPPYTFTDDMTILIG